MKSFGLRVLVLASVVCSLLCVGLSARAQAYTSIVVIGDSLSDTGNDAAVSSGLYTVNAQVPGPASGYTNGRFTDGPDTIPAARLYTGVWIEQLAAQLAAKPAILNSLAGGTNYAYGYATTNTGTGTLAYGPGNVFVIPVNNMGLQLSTYLATNPTINSSTLFVVWGGANDLLQANGSTAVITQAAQREVALVQQLITAGATDFIVPNLPPLGLVPEFNGSAATSAPATLAAQGFNAVLAAGLAALPSANPGKTLRIYALDTYTLFNTIVTSPPTYGISNVQAMSQFNPTINPDTYLFWDFIHPTTYGHSLVASAALHLLQGPISTTVAVTSSNLNANLNSSVLLTAAVTATAGSPQGTVTFLDGANAIGSLLVTGAAGTGTAILKLSTLAAGTHSITASFAGVNGYANSTSAALSEVIVPPSYTAAAAPTNVTVQPGGSSATTVTITPAGGYLGSFTVACASPVASITCTVTTPGLSITGASAVSTAIQLTASAQALAHRPSRPGERPTPLTPMLALMPLAGLLLCNRRKFRRLGSIGLLAGALVLGAVATMGLSGCTGSATTQPVLTVAVPVTVTPATGTATSLTLNVTVP